MKNIFLNHFHESEIKPQALYEQWKKALEKDLLVLFPDKKKFVAVGCPGCGKHNFKSVFTKFGFEYQRCNLCDSLFVSPRPNTRTIRKFYKNSQAVKFWGKKIVKVSMAARRRHQLFPLYVWLVDLIKDYKPEARVVVDYEPKYFSLFLPDKNFYTKFEKIIFINPLVLERNFSTKNIKVINNFSDLKNKVDVFTAFEVLDREFDPTSFIRQVSKACRKGGLFLLTANTISGFEYQILGKNSQRLVPPDRLNLLSIEAIHQLLTNEGFRILDISSPGKLDVEIVANTFKNNPNIDMPEFLKYMFKHRSEDVWENLQDFLQLNKLSSYLRIVAIKK